MIKISILIISLALDIRTKALPTGCQVNEWKCSDGTCIPIHGRCDNFPDCGDGSDEQNCLVSPVCLEGLESCPQPNGTTVCVDKAVGCGCGSVPKVTHGTIISDNITIGSIADVTCDTGYDATLSTVTCQISGSWETASCIPKDCGPVKKIAFGKIDLSDINNTTYGATGNVLCDAGYETLTPIVRCQGSGNWDTALCTAKDCGPVEKIAFGKIDLSDINNATYGATGNVLCDAGYETLTPIVRCQGSGNWDTALCTAKDCGPVKTIAFGKIDLSDINNTTYGVTGNVLCDAGYETLTPIVRCQGSGNWDTALCTAKDCGPVKKIAFGKIDLSDINNTTYGATGNVLCDAGYETLTQIVRCQGSGNWDTALCTARDCGPVEKIAFGKIDLSDINNTTYGATGNVLCDAGYETLTPIVRCQGSGNWDTALCTAKDCGPVKTITFGKIDLSDINNTTYGVTGNVLCDAGYETLTPIVRCQGSGNWDTALCTAKDCGPVKKIDFGKIDLSDINNTTYGATGNVLCDAGYETLTPIVRCQGSGNWDTALCTARDCGPVEKIAFGKIDLSDINNATYGATGNVLCDAGYETLTQIVRCQGSGNWDTALCTARDCGPVKKIAFGKIDLSDINNTTYGATGNVLCDAGYETLTPIVRCQGSGNWDTALCTARDCRSPPPIPFGAITLKDDKKTILGATATVTCNSGYFENVQEITCQSSGIWESALCFPKDCGYPRAIEFGNITLSDENNSTYGATAFISCIGNYAATATMVKCQSSGLWENATCVSTGCGPVPKLSHGKTALTGNASTGSTSIVICNDGYEASKKVVMCQISGDWEIAACTPKNCGSVAAIPFGKITLTDSNNTTLGASADVTCDAGYETNVSKVMCLSTGFWEMAVCTIQGCRSLPVIHNGKIIVTSNTSVGSSANVTCDTGYTESIPVVKCQTSGFWETANCTPKACGSVPAIQLGKINLVDADNVSFGAAAEVVCDIGYITNTSKIECQSSGFWEPAMCTAIDCGPPTLISNGKITLRYANKSTYGNEALVKCNMKYVATSSKITCQSSGEWETARCISESKLNYDRCTEEHGVCTQHIYENVRLLALKGSKCKAFCHCAHAATISDGSVTYKWVERNCPSGTLFDDNLPSPVCNHAYMVWC